MSKEKSKQEEFEQEEQEQKKREKRERKKEKRKQKESGLKLHHYRFVKFIDYLKRHEGEIKIVKEDEATGERHSLTYNLGERGGLPFKDLIIEALNIREARAEDYITNSRGLTNTHAIGERYSGLGNTITSIEFYFSDDTPLGEKSSLKDYYDPYAIRLPGEIEQIEDKSDVEKLRKKTLSNFLNIQFKEHVISSFRDCAEDDKPREILQYLNAYTIGLFARESKQLQKYLVKQNKVHDLSFEIFDNQRKDMVEAYCQLAENLPPPLFIPGYIDFKFPRRVLQKDKNYDKEEFDVKVEYILNNVKAAPLKEIINFRYEILWYLIDRNITVDDWHSKVQVLLLIVNYECYALQNGLFDFVDDLMIKKIRFVVFGMDGDNCIKAQRDSLDIDELVSVLFNYQFNRGVDQAFKVQDNQILNYPLYKYPEAGALKQPLTKLYIMDSIFHALGDHFENRLESGSGVPLGE